MISTKKLPFQGNSPHSTQSVCVLAGVRTGTTDRQIGKCATASCSALPAVQFGRLIQHTLQLPIRLLTLTARIKRPHFGNAVITKGGVDVLVRLAGGYTVVPPHVVSKRNPVPKGSVQFCLMRAKGAVWQIAWSNHNKIRASGVRSRGNVSAVSVVQLTARKVSIVRHWGKTHTLHSF